MQLTLISGLSGSGKSIALNVLEDAGYYCVDNLPVTLLLPLMDILTSAGYERVGVAIDVRAGASISDMPAVLTKLRESVPDIRLIFLDARDDTLVARFSETRRRHPLSTASGTVEEAIADERELLSEIAALAQRIDTSKLHPNSLRAWVKNIIDVAPSSGMTLLFQSFGFKYGIPVDADFVFDVRCLPNPYYDPALRPQTGQDAAVIDFLCQQPEVVRMEADIAQFTANWLPSFVRDNRSYLTIAIGCTGGQHRSVYLAERLASAFREQINVVVRHRSFAITHQ